MALKTQQPWWTGEHAVRLSRLSDHLPAGADGRPVSTATAYRYTTAGLDGVVLRRFRGCGAYCTTVEEVARWQAALTAEAAR